MSNPTQTLEPLQRALEEFQRIDREMPLQVMQTLLYVHNHPGCGHEDLMEHLNLQSSTISRIVARLGKWEALHKPGDDLLISEPGTDRRRREVYLTPKGQKLIAALQKAFNN